MLREIERIHLHNCYNIPHYTLMHYNISDKYGFLMLVLPPILRRVAASQSRASLCSIGAGFLELVIFRGTFNPENHELRVKFQLARHIHPRKTRRFGSFLPSAAIPRASITF
jgi:hypothetical protein